MRNKHLAGFIPLDSGFFESFPFFLERLDWLAYLTKCVLCQYAFIQCSIEVVSYLFAFVAHGDKISISFSASDTAYR